MKIAVIGIGNWGQVLLKELKAQVEVKYECDSKTDLDPILSDPEVEAVFVATPISTHFEVASRVLNAGKHLFMEKPGTTSSLELEKIVELAKSKNLKLAIGYEFPHHPAFKKIKELTAGKEIKYVRYEFQKWGNFDTDIVSNFLCHDVSILKYLEVDTSSPSSTRLGVVTDTDILTTQFGMSAISVISRVSTIKHRSVMVLLEDGGYLFSDNELFSIDKEGQKLNKIEIDTTTPVAIEIADFLSAIKDNRTPMMHGEFAIEVYKNIEKV